MSQLPDGWTLTSLGAVADVNPAPTQHAERDELVSFVPMAAVEVGTGHLDASDQRPLSALAGKSYRSFAEGDILFAKITPCMENGKIAIASGLAHGTGFGSTEFHVIRPHQAAHPRYLLHFLLQSKFRRDARRQMTGTAGQLRVPTRYLSEAAVPLPPFAEQERIVAAIEEEFSRIDAGVASLAHAETRLTAMRAATLAGIADDRRCSPVLLGTLVAGVRAGKSFRCDTRAAGEGEWGVIKVSAMTWGRFLEEENKALLPDAIPNPEYEIQPGDVLVSRANTVDYVGAVVRVPPCRRRLLLGDKSVRVTAKSGVGPSWLVAVLQMPGTRRQIEHVATGTSDSMRNISQPKLMSLLVPSAGLDDQRRFLGRLAVIDGALEQLRKRIKSAERRSQALRVAVLSAAFAGRLVSRHLGDGPASNVLGRIRGEGVIAKGRKEQAGPQGGSSLYE